MKRIARILTVFLAISALQAQPKSLVIFHTNDIHGHFVPEPATWRGESALVGGVASLEYYLDSLRVRYPQSLYLDAGDLMTGNPVCNLQYKGVKGGALLEMLSRLNVAAECLGNHEFDLGETHLRQYVSAARYPLLCANVRDHNGASLLTAVSTVVTVAGIRVGIVGLILEGLTDVVAKANVASFVVDDVASTAQKQIDALDSETDLIVLLTHLGVEGDSLLATRIRGADVIVGGHSHTRLPQPLRVNNVVIVQAGSYLKNLGVLELAIDGDSVASYHGRLVELDYRNDYPRTALSALADSLEQVIQARYGQVIGTLAETWTPGYYTGSNVGNWVCDRLRERFKADVALINAGGLRTTWKKGAISTLDVLEMSPFENFVTVFEGSGKDLLKVAAEQARAQGLHAHGALEMSGMTVDYRKVGDRVAVVAAKVAGRPIEPSRKYRLVSIDYVSVSQADRYLHFVPPDQETTAQMLSDVMTDVIKEYRAPLHADPAPRLVEVP